MFLRHNQLLIKLTLFFFVSMVSYNPALAQQQLPKNLHTGKTIYGVPVTYVTQQQAEQIILDAQSRGYSVEEGTLQQLAELELSKPVEEPTAEKMDEKKQKPPCDEKISKDKTETLNKKDTPIPVDSPEAAKDKQLGEKECKDKSDKENKKAVSSEEQPAGMEVQFPEPQAVPAPVPPPEPLPPPQPPQPTVQTNIGIQADIGYGHSGGRGDSGKVFFILAGIMVIAAFIVYAGKYIADLASGKDYKVWWEFIFSNTYLSTSSGQHGRLNGLKIATGFVSSDLIQVALVGEVGNTDIDLILDEDSLSPVPLNYTATYWMLGATARLHLSDKLVNASYLYLDFMGGKTSQGSADTIGMARLGASFGINDYLRLGGSIGAHYIGLDEDQGFANHGDNYWTTIGFEMGVKF